MMPQVVVDVMMALSTAESGVAHYELPSLCGWSDRRADYAYAALRRIGLAESRMRRRYLTERGKIALAIEIGCRTKRRGKFKRLSFEKWLIQTSPPKVRGRVTEQRLRA